MKNLLDEYKAYYKVRASRFKNNPKYQHSYNAEQVVSEAMQSCSELSEFKEKLGDKNEKCAPALIKDKYLMRKTHYEEMEETVRLECVNKILTTVDKCLTALDVATHVTEIETQNGIDISMDEANRHFISEWDRIDKIEIYENAEVPSKYQHVIDERAAKAKEKLKDSVNSLEENNDKWRPGWKHTPEIILEHRHKRLLPYKEMHIKEQLNKYRLLINR